MIRHANGLLIGILPLAMSINSNVLISHPKSTYGGIQFLENLALDIKKQIYEEVIHYLTDKFPGITLDFRLAPSFSDPAGLAASRWILWNLGFKPSSIFLHSFVDLNKQFVFTPGRVKRVFDEKLHFFETNSPTHIDSFWSILQENLRTRHRAEPVHTKSQIIQLKDKFKEKIRVFLVGEEADNILGGLVFFNTTNVFHLQYMAIDLVGKSKSLGDFLITRVMETAVRENYDFFAFGHSNENFGRDLNVGLLSFKEKFGSELSDAIWWRKNLGGDS